MWFDISIDFQPAMPIYPGDPTFKATPVKIGGLNSRVTLHRLELGTHTGTHVDAPCHVFPGAKTITDLPIEAFIGPCFVLAVKKFSLNELKRLPPKAERVLIKANYNLPENSSWLEVYQGMPPEFASQIIKQNPRVLLVGIDALSIEEKGRRVLETHQLFLARDTVILEGLNLSKIIEGWYDLSALPLKLRNLDGSPVRAVLKKRDGEG